MIRLPPGAVILDPAEVDYVARALDYLGQLMAERRDGHGNPTPSQPSARLTALTAKLRRTVDSLPVVEPAGDRAERAEPSARPSDVRALQRDSVHGGRHELGTGEAAR
ncbi:MAG: hypothetical protein KAH46_27770, partial [Mycobacterium sp.]|nr:hypothetical protein [Mycobacterium sp.]